MISDHRTAALSELMVTCQESVDPSKSLDEVFQLFSIPAYDAGKPEVRIGRQIGSTKKLVKPGDVLLSRIVPHIRRAWVVPEGNGKRQIASGEWIVFRSERFYSNYLCYLLTSDTFHARFMNTVAGVGGSLLRARPAFVADIHVPLPSLSEQRRIGDMLDKAHAIKQQRQVARNMAATLPSSIFYQHFGDPLRDSERSKVAHLGDLFAVPPNYGTMAVPSDREGSWLDLRVANIQNGELDLSERKYVELASDMISRHEVLRGDLLLARAIGSIQHLGKCIIANPVGQKWAFDSHLMRVRFDANKVEPRYVHAFLTTPGGRHEFLRNARRSAVQFNINTKELAKIRIPLPPLSAQRRFVAALEKLDSLVSRQRQATKVAESLFQSLSYRAFHEQL